MRMRATSRFMFKGEKFLVGDFEEELTSEVNDITQANFVNAIILEAT